VSACTPSSQPSTNQTSTPRCHPCHQEAVSVPYLTGRPWGRRALAALLRPLMWRNSKDVASEDAPLPPRAVVTALLRFSPAERSYYDHVLAKIREGQERRRRDRERREGELEERRRARWGPPALEGGGGGSGGTGGEQQGGAPEAQKQEAEAAGAGEVPADPAAGGPQDHEEQQQPQQQPAAAASGSAPRPAAARRGRKRGKATVMTTETELLQLRMACVHPQLTQYCEFWGLWISGVGCMYKQSAYSLVNLFVEVADLHPTPSSIQGASCLLSSSWAMAAPCPSLRSSPAWWGADPPVAVPVAASPPCCVRQASGAVFLITITHNLIT
jgi:hypothetical protein